MAKVALIKLFTGLNLAVSQLSAELRRAGHESLIIYLKDYVAIPRSEAGRYPITDYAGINVYARGAEWIWNCYKPITETEYGLLFSVLREFGAQLVGFSLTSAGLPLAAEVTERIREELHLPVVWGGTGPTLEPERCIESADIVCLHEGEQVIVELAERVDRGLDFDDIQGIWTRRGDSVVKNPSRPLLDLESIAAPDFARAHTVYIENDTLFANVYPHNLMNQYAIMTARGCPFSCSFCVESVLQDMFGKKGSLRRRSVDIVIDELLRAKETLGITSVLFYDDVFTTHRKWLEEFGPKYRNRVGLPFWCYTYPTTTRRADIEILRDAGCVTMTMGIQSGSQRILNERLGRPAPLDQAVEAIQIVLDAGIQCFFDLITKVEFETETDVRQTFDLLASLPRGAQSQGFGHMTLFPNYGYTRSVAGNQQRHALSDEDYRYWHRMYLLAITPLPAAAKRAILHDPTYRAHPELLEPMLRTRLPLFFLPDRGSNRRPVMLDTAIAQATIPAEFTDPPLANAPADLRRRLTVMS